MRALIEFVEFAIVFVLLLGALTAVYRMMSNKSNKKKEDEAKSNNNVS